MDYGKRWYDSSIGRFTTIDSLAEKYAFQSPYAYAANDPVRFIDVFGMFPESFNVGPKESFDQSQNGISPLINENHCICNNAIAEFPIPLLFPLIPAVEAGIVALLATWGIMEVHDIAKDAVQDYVDKIEEVDDSSKNEKHGDNGRAKSKSEQQIENLKKQMAGATKKVRKGLQNKINNIRKAAQKAGKGEEHSRIPKR